MGTISKMRRDAVGRGPTLQQNPFSQRGALWRQVFGDTRNKYDGPLISKEEREGGSFGRSLPSSTGYAQKRLLEALRSMAPGGWSDNRWEQTKHFTGIQYVAIHRQNELLTQAEFQVYVKDDQHQDGKRPITKDDPPMGDRLVKPYDLVDLLEKPNNDDNFGDLCANWNLQMDLTGMALTWMVPNKLGTPIELYPIPTAIAVPQPAVNPDFPDGYYRIQPVYPYGPFSSYPTPASAVGAAIPRQWMLRFKFPHPLLRYEGYSPLTALRLHIDEIEGIDRSRWYSMKRSVNPSAVLNFDEVEGMTHLDDAEIARIHSEWENNFQGPENHGNLIVGTPGGRFEPWGASPHEMEYQAGWEQLVSFALGGFGITKPAAGMIEDTNYSVLFATLKQLYWLTLGPKAHRFGQKLTKHLAPFFGDDLIVEVTCKRIDDHEIDFGRINHGMQAKCITKNEVRKMLDLPMTDQLWGDEMAGFEAPPMLPPGMPIPGQPGMEGLPPGAEMVPGGVPPEMMQQGVPGNLPPGVMMVEGEEGTAPNEEGENLDEWSELEQILGLSQEEIPEDEMEKDRPTPESLGRGALGPRKFLTNGNRLLNGHNKSLLFMRRRGEFLKTKSKVNEVKEVKKETKSIYDQVREVISNGKH